VISKLSVLNVYKKKTKKSIVVTQLLYGDTFKKLGQKNSWVKIKNDLDNYIGYIKNGKFSQNHKNTHKVSVLCSNLYLKPNNKNKIRKKLSFGSKINVTNKKRNFYKFDNLWIKKKDLKKISFKTKDSFKNINKFIIRQFKISIKLFYTKIYLNEI